MVNAGHGGCGHGDVTVGLASHQWHRGTRSQEQLRAAEAQRGCRVTLPCVNRHLPQRGHWGGGGEGADVTAPVATAPRCYHAGARRRRATTTAGDKPLPAGACRPPWLAWRLPQRLSATGHRPPQPHTPPASGRAEVDGATMATRRKLGAANPAAERLRRRLLPSLPRSPLPAPPRPEGRNGTSQRRGPRRCRQ